MTNDSAGPSPRSMSTAQAASSTSTTNSKAKRPMASTTASSMPRPLHLALGSVVGSSSSPSTPGSVSPCPSPGPSQRLTVNGSSPSDGDDAGLGLAGSSSANTPDTSRAPSPSPLSPAMTGLKRNSAKRSSISYIPSNGPSSSQNQYGQRSSMDGFVRSPLSSTHPPTSFHGERGRNSGAGLSRSSSVGSRGPRTSKGSTFNEKVEPGFTSAGTNQDEKETNGSSQMPAHLKERPPVTLAEKHAELLHFIAQKESKCLELRSQLAVHEAELLQLKRKWERIVNRGFERSMSPGAANASSPLPLATSLFSTSPTSPPTFSNVAGPSSTAASSSYFPNLAPAGVVPGAVVFEGIKGGVQGMSRLIAAGIESIVLVNGTSTPATPSTHESDVSASKKSIPPRLDLAPVSKHSRVHGHEQKESQSSSSTTTSTTSSSTFSSSLSSASSAATTASVSGSSTSGNTTRKSARSSSSTSGSSGADADADSEFGEFEEGRASLSLETEHQLDQVLMVEDTGATPTMSPNPHFRRRKEAVEQEHIHVEKLVLTSESQADNGELSVNSAKKAVEEEFDWDDGWGESVGPGKAQDREGEASDAASLSGDAVVAAGQTKSGSSLSLPLAPTIPSLGALNVAAPTTQQMSSWVGSVGKKWGELKGSTTFTKSQKRASLLLSDMQNTILSTLISPPPSSTTPMLSTPTQTPSASNPPPSSFSSNASHSSSSSSSRSPKLAPSLSPSPRLALSRSTASLLDDDSDGEPENASSSSVSGVNGLRLSKSSRIVVPVMVPDSLSPPASTLALGLSQSSLRKGKAAPSSGAYVPQVVDDDEWNW